MGYSFVYLSELSRAETRDSDFSCNITQDTQPFHRYMYLRFLNI